MSHRIVTIALTLITLLSLAACGDTGSTDQATSGVSGRVEAGLRVLTIDPAATEPTKLTVYRGDYVRVESTNDQPVTIFIPELKVAKTYPVAEGEKAYFKLPNTGTFTYTVGSASGVIEAIEYKASGYSEVSAAEGAELIKNINPLVLDVRTPGEFAQGHLVGAKLIPVQVLQAELGQLAGYEDKPIFVYCRSGNRSTVAAKVLKDKGFTNVVNLRHGIGEWAKLNLPIEK